jgi:hypothetical protein
MLVHPPWETHRHGREAPHNSAFMGQISRWRQNGGARCAYRERHRGQRIQLFLNTHAKKQLDRLACHERYTVTDLTEEWAASGQAVGDGEAIRPGS